MKNNLFSERRYFDPSICSSAYLSFHLPASLSLCLSFSLSLPLCLDIQLSIVFPWKYNFVFDPYNPSNCTSIIVFNFTPILSLHASEHKKKYIFFCAFVYPTSSHPIHTIHLPFLLSFGLCVLPTHTSYLSILLSIYFPSTCVSVVSFHECLFILLPLYLWLYVCPSWIYHIYPFQSAPTCSSVYFSSVHASTVLSIHSSFHHLLIRERIFYYFVYLSIVCPSLDSTLYLATHPFYLASPTLANQLTHLFCLSVHHRSPVIHLPPIHQLLPFIYIDTYFSIYLSVQASVWLSYCATCQLHIQWVWQFSNQTGAKQNRKPTVHRKATEKFPEESLTLHRLS